MDEEFLIELVVGYDSLRIEDYQSLNGPEEMHGSMPQLDWAEWN
jgi:hypothetical protein